MKPAFLPQGNKYHNVKTEIDGIIFASKKEGNYYIHLKDKRVQGEIKDFKMQVPFELVPAQREVRTVGFRKDGSPINKEKVAELAVKYVADFVVEHPDGTLEVIDTKGMRDAKYKIKKKLMRYVHGIVIREV
jgi:predicted ATP-dependent endonuclease of OLD family